MIYRDKLNILNDVLESAQTILKQYKSLSETMTEVLSRSEVYLKTNPTDLLDIFKRVHDMQMQSLTTLNSVLEKFPVEHTIQELQLLEIFRNLTEKQKQSLFSQLEYVIKGANLGR